MKKITRIVILLFGALTVNMKAFAYDISGLGKDIIDNTKVTLLESANGAYFYDMRGGNDHNSRGGTIDHVITFYNFLSADIGIVSTPGQNPQLVAGPGIQLDKLVTFVAPEFTAYVNSFVPASAQNFWKACFVGLSGGWDANTATFQYYFDTGISLKY